MRMHEEQQTQVQQPLGLMQSAGLCFALLGVKPLPQSTRAAAVAHILRFFPIIVFSASMAALYRWAEWYALGMGQDVLRWAFWDFGSMLVCFCCLECLLPLNAFWLLLLLLQAL